MPFLNVRDMTNLNVKSTPNDIVMNKSTNKYRHKWVEPFDAPFTYICSKCGKHKIKETMYTATYYDENMNPLGSKSPECVSKQPSIQNRYEQDRKIGGRV